MAWENAGKAFIPAQLVLDELTTSRYLVPGIPSAGTLALDPHAKVFDPTKPLEPFKVADAKEGLEGLSKLSEFQSTQKALREALAVLLIHKEAIMSAVDVDYQRYLDATAESLGQSDSLMRAIAKNKRAVHAIARNEDAMRALAEDEEALRNLAKNEAAMLKLMGPEAFEVWKKSQLP